MNMTQEQIQKLDSLQKDFKFHTYLYLRYNSERLKQTSLRILKEIEQLISNKETNLFTDEQLSDAIELAKEGNIGYHAPDSLMYYFEHSEQEIKTIIKQAK